MLHLHFHHHSQPNVCFPCWHVLNKVITQLQIWPRLVLSKLKFLCSLLPLLITYCQVFLGLTVGFVPESTQVSTLLPNYFSSILSKCSTPLLLQIQLNAISKYVISNTTDTFKSKIAKMFQLDQSQINSAKFS